VAGTNQTPGKLAAANVTGSHNREWNIKFSKNHRKCKNEVILGRYFYIKLKKKL
jgi:hypothetical protein